MAVHATARDSNVLLILLCGKLDRKSKLGALRWEEMGVCGVCVCVTKVGYPHRVCVGGSSLRGQGGVEVQLP